jgi:type I restriction enzyme S subunit
LFKVTSQRYPRWFFAEWVHVHLEEFERIAAYKATTMGHIQRSHLNAALTNCPPDDVIARFSPVFEPMIERTIQAALESRTLAAIRDTLLPKLVSGELRVNDAETFLDRVL